MSAFRARLWRYPGPGGWTFVNVPDDHAPDVAGAWGRAPVIARVDGREWATSAWRDRREGWLLPVPAKVRGRKAEGDEVDVELRADPTRSPS